jgi:hypothetical protein
MPDNRQVSQEMIEAGHQATFDKFILDDDELAEIYFAMNAARTMDDAPDARLQGEETVPITPEIHAALNRALMASTKTVGVMIAPEQLEAMREALEECRLIVANLPHGEAQLLAKIDAALEGGSE